MGLNLCDRCVADCRHHREPNEIVVQCGAFKPPMTNADRIRAMSDQELAAFLDRISIEGDEPWESIFKTTFCDCCPTVEVTEEDGTQHHLNECDFADGVCPHGKSIQWWLKQPAEKK